MRLGHILVLVPEDGLDVEVESTIEGAGESVLFGDRRDGSMDRPTAPATPTRISP